MNVALRPTITLEEFLAWEERQELRYEFDGYRAIAVAGVTNPAAILALPEIGIEVPLLALYDGLEFGDGSEKGD